MKSVEKTGKTVDNAITDALIELGATTEQVEIQVLEKGSKGFLGFGAKDARVRVTLKERPQAQDLLQSSEVEHTPSMSRQEVEDKKHDEQVSQKEITPITQATETAEKFLKDVLTEMGLNATLETQQVGDRVYINILGEKMGMVIGKRGDTLDALQYLTNIVVNKGHHGYVKIMLDTENYRKRREDTLRKVAYKFAKKAEQTKKPAILEPMNPYDRRIVHSALQDSKTVKTHSEGKEPFRRVVITPLISEKHHNQ